MPRRIELPDIETLAAMVRAAGIDTVAADFECSPQAVRTHLNHGGYNKHGHLLGANDKPSDELPAPVVHIQPWANRGLCREVDPDMFFPEKGGSTNDAKGVCRECPVTTECLTYALENHERFGIWGGMSERDRRKLERRPPGRPRQRPKDTPTAHIEHQLEEPA